MQSKWIWYRGDYEFYHGLKLHMRRKEFGCDYPAFWNQPNVYPTVTFMKTFHTDKDGYVKILACGKGYVMFDNTYRFNVGEDIFFGDGDHTVVVRICNPTGLPCIYAISDTFCTDRSWLVSPNTEDYINAGDTPEYTEPEKTPEVFPFGYKKITPESSRQFDNGVLYDFGRETFAELSIENAVDTENFTVYFGESEEEATDTKNALLFERLSGKMSYRLPACAFRYVYIPVKLAGSFSVSAFYEFLPLEDIGSFECGDRLIDKVWRVSAYTFHLCSREFFIDGIKRDRWVWGGDAYQSFMINDYLFHDNGITRRTLTLLLGKEPYSQHVNTITDYSLYVIMGAYNYYFSSGDVDFIKFILPRLKALYGFIVSNLDERGYIVYRRGYWIFIDWADIDKGGANCGEQMLLYKAMLDLSLLCEAAGEDGSEYRLSAEKLYESIQRDFWRQDRGAYIDSCDSGLEKVGRHINVLAIMTGTADERKRDLIIENVLKNSAVPPITTPYFGFYELDVLCSCGELEYAAERMRSYWGGMLKLGATSIWEQYIPTEQGAEHYAMYNMKYGKSLCHAWGAGPVYLLGKYFLGVKVTAPGASAFEVRPQLGVFEKIMGTVPLEDGYVYVEYENGKLKVYTDKEGGTLILGNKKLALKKDETLTAVVEL